MRGSDVEEGQPPARVLMVVRLFHPWVGGTERQAQKLSRGLLDAGADVQLVTGWWFRGTPQQEAIDGVPVFRNLTLWEFFGIKGLRKLGGYLYICTLMWHLWRRAATYDVIHVHGLNYHTFAAVVMGRRLGKPVVVKLANSGPASDITRMREGRQLAGSGLLLATALRCDRFVALNAKVVAELLDAGVEPDRIVELPNGVATRVPQRSAYGRRAGGRLLYVGRLHPQKGLDTLLRALALLLAEDPGEGPTLRLVGEGPARRDLEELTGVLGIRDHVEFPGAREDLEADWEGADVFVLPSRAEGLSNALLEAMARGIPVVVSDIPGNRDVVSHEVDGLLTPQGDAPALAGILSRLIASAGLRAVLGTNARRTVEERYGMERIAAEYLRLYRAVTSDPDVAAAPIAKHEGASS